MRTRHALLALPAACAIALALAPAGSALAAETYSIQLSSLNGSGATGTAMVTANDDGSLTVQIEATGLVPNAPHAQHLHGGTKMTQDFMCPGPDRDTDGDGIVSTAEGIPDYGDVFIALTTEGDTSKASGLAIDRFPMADAQGGLSYQRTIPAASLPEGTIAAIKNLHVVQHGIDDNDNGLYDADAGPSSLDPSLPLEATAPANCGMIMGSSVTSVPQGGVETGTSTSSGPADLMLLGLGGTTLAGAAVLFTIRRRATATQ